MNQQPTENQIRDTYDLAKERYATIGVDADAALARLAGIPISLHCWQGDDAAGFENPEGELGGGGSGCWSRSSASSGSQSYHEQHRL